MTVKLNEPIQLYNNGSIFAEGVITGMVQDSRGVEITVYMDYAEQERLNTIKKNPKTGYIYD